MTIRDITIKNFKYNMKKYLAYFLCSSFTITILFMYGTLYYNEQILKNVLETPIYKLMQISLIGLAIFCFLFISYANSTFMRARNSEFGLFLILGMSKQDIDKIIRIENGLMSLFSLATGLISGTILSKLFFMIAMKILQLNDIQYSLNYKSYLITIIVFLVINIIMFLKRKWFIRKLGLTELIKDARHSKEGNFYPVLGILGIVMIPLSYILFHLTLMEVIFKNMTFVIGVYVIMCFVGLYLAITHFGALLIYFNKKNYYRNILSLTSVKYRFSDYKKILYVVAILSSGAIFFIGLTYGIYVNTMDRVNKENPYDIMYANIIGMDNISKEKLNSIIQQDEANLDDIKTLDFAQISLYKKTYEDYSLWSKKTSVISESNINVLLHDKIDVKEGQAVSLRPVKETKPWYNKGAVIKLEDIQGNKYNYNFQEEIYGAVVNRIYSRDYDTIFMIILDDEDYNQLMKQGNMGQSTIYLYKFKKSKKIENIYVDIVEEELGSNIDKQNIIKLKYSRQLKVSSRLIEYKASISENGFNLFIMGFIGLLFFITSGVVLYFKILSDMDEAKKKYKKLFKVGITEKEISKVISKELKPLFFIPIILGSLIGIGYIAVMMVNISGYYTLLLNALFVVIIYLILQSIFYMITKRRYCEEVI